MYEVVFTNVHTHMDYVGTASKETLIPLIMDMLGNGLFLSELRLKDEQAS